MTAAPLILRAGLLEVQLLPGIGGAIARFDRIAGERWQPLLRGSAPDVTHPTDASCFPLVPYVNRIRGGRFTVDGRTVTIAPNMPPDPSPMHGQGWLGAWQVAEAADDYATLTFHHPAGEWPWEWEATQRFRLDADGLSLELTCRNLSADRMPCGLGFHPYYPCDDRTILETDVASAWTIDDKVLPVANVPAAGRYDLKQRHVCGQSLDNGFDGWSGSATITWPDEAASVRLTSPDAGRFQVYSPPTGGLFVAEPVQQANAALNAPQEQWAELGIELLGQGKERTLHARFDVVVGAPR